MNLCMLGFALAAAMPSPQAWPVLTSRPGLTSLGPVKIGRTIAKVVGSQSK
ncbi:MAG: hypothetical protein ABI603_06615 [Acidobacteriota bacterium]